jgi:DNA-binding transcriptional MerR regulator
MHAGDLRVLGIGHSAPLQLEAEFRRELPEPALGGPPVGAAVEVDELNVHPEAYPRPSSQREGQEACTVRIGEIAATGGVPAKTIRFWEERGLLPQPARTPAGYRTYDAAVIDRLAFIRSAQVAGFSLDEIRQVLDIGDSGTAACEHVRELVDGRLASVEARIDELKATRAHLRLLARRAAEQDPAECHGYCAILQPPPAVRAAAR